MGAAQANEVSVPVSDHTPPVRARLIQRTDLVVAGAWLIADHQTLPIRIEAVEGEAEPKPDQRRSGHTCRFCTYTL